MHARIMGDALSSQMQAGFERLIRYPMSGSFCPSLRCITSALGSSQPCVPLLWLSPRPGSQAFVCFLGRSGHRTRPESWLCPLDRRRPLPLRSCALCEFGLRTPAASQPKQSRSASRSGRARQQRVNKPSPSASRSRTAHASDESKKPSRLLPCQFAHAAASKKYRQHAGGSACAA